MALLIGGAWLIAIVAQVTGNAGLLHHHELIEGGFPLWLGAVLFALSWQVMIAAMMLPASVPAMRVMGASVAAPRGRSPMTGDGAIVLAVFAMVWTVFGLFAFGGDAVLHHVVDANPWLAERPWLIEGGVLAFAGVYQVSPLKARSLAACRHPFQLLATHATRPGAHSLGLDHAFACLGSSWALMLLMFAEGFANLWWMVALTALMTYEVLGARGELAARAAGVAIVILAAVVVGSGVVAPG